MAGLLPLSISGLLPLSVSGLVALSIAGLAPRIFGLGDAVRTGEAVLGVRFVISAGEKRNE